MLLLGFNIFLETPERSGKGHDEVVVLAAAKKYRAFVDKTLPASDVAQRLVTLSRARALAKFLRTYEEMHPSFLSGSTTGQSKR